MFENPWALTLRSHISQQYIRKPMGFNFEIAYKPGINNQAADGLSRVYEEGDMVTTMFMATSHPMVVSLELLQIENKSLKELLDINSRLNQGELIEGFRQQEGVLI